MPRSTELEVICSEHCLVCPLKQNNENLPFSSLIITTLFQDLCIYLSLQLYESMSET